MGLRSEEYRFHSRRLEVGELRFPSVRQQILKEKRGPRSISEPARSRHLPVMPVRQLSLSRRTVP